MLLVPLLPLIYTVFLLPSLIIGMILAGWKPSQWGWLIHLGSVFIAISLQENKIVLPTLTSLLWMYVTLYSSYCHNLSQCWDQAQGALCSPLSVQNLSSPSLSSAPCGFKGFPPCKFSSDYCSCLADPLDPFRALSDFDCSHPLFLSFDILKCCLAFH